MRVGIVSLFHESNTFVPQPTTWDHFREGGVFAGEAMRDRYAATRCEVGGMFAGLAEHGVEAVPVYAARAVPYGVVTADAWTNLLAVLGGALDEAGPLDGWLVAPHGAMVSEPAPDADGAWLTLLREHVGNVPIIGTLDLHANLSPAMVAACDALIGYRTNPHLDMRARGLEAAALMGRTLRGEARPTMAAAFPPLAINIERQSTAADPCRAIYADADRMIGGKVLSNTVLLGFPYADVAEMGSAVIAVTDGDRALARSAADILAAGVWGRREELVGRLVTVADAVEIARTAAGPVGLLDMGDNVGGGAPGDGTLLAHALVRAGVLPAFVCLHAPAAVRAAGDFVGAVGSPPIQGRFTVRGRFDGRYADDAVRHGGQTAYDQGPTAVLGAGGLTVMATSRRVGPWSLAQLTAFGLDPLSFRAIVIKGVHAPVAAYAPVCPTLVRVNTPGTTAADLNALTFHRRRRPMFPFEAEASR